MLTLKYVWDRLVIDLSGLTCENKWGYQPSAFGSSCFFLKYLNSVTVGISTKPKMFLFSLTKYWELLMWSSSFLLIGWFTHDDNLLDCKVSIDTCTVICLCAIRAPVLCEIVGQV